MNFENLIQSVTDYPSYLQDLINMKDIINNIGQHNIEKSCIALQQYIKKDNQSWIEEICSVFTYTYVTRTKENAVEFCVAMDNLYPKVFINILTTFLSFKTGKLFRELFASRLITKEQVIQTIERVQDLSFFINDFDEFLNVKFPTFSSINEEERKDIIEYGCLKNSLEYIIKFDLLEDLTEKSSDMDFDFYQPLYQNFFEATKLSMLGYAARFGAVRCFKFLIINFPMVDEEIVENAIIGGNSEIIHICHQHRGNFSTALETGIRYHRNDIIDWMIMNIDKDMLSKTKKAEEATQKKPLIEIALESKNYEAFWWLYREGKETHKHHRAFISSRSPELCKIFVKKRKPKYCFEALSVNSPTLINFFLDSFSIDTVDNQQKTMLYLAAEQGLFEVSKYLLSNGASADGLSPERRPLVAAVSNSHQAIASLLLEYGANAELGSDGGKTSLHIAAAEGHKEIVDFLFGFLDPNVTDSAGQTSLFDAIANNQIDMCKLLLESGADVNAEDLIGQTPLIIACQNNFEEIAKVLLDYGAEPNSRPWTGKTALHWSVLNNNISLTEIILKAGASTSIFDTIRKTASDLAASEDFERLFDLYRKNRESV